MIYFATASSDRSKLIHLWVSWSTLDPLRGKPWRSLWTEKCCTVQLVAQNLHQNHSSGLPHLSPLIKLWSKYGRSVSSDAAHQDMTQMQSLEEVCCLRYLRSTVDLGSRGFYDTLCNVSCRRWKFRCVLVGRRLFSLGNKNSPVDVRYHDKQEGRYGQEERDHQKSWKSKICF